MATRYFDSGYPNKATKTSGYGNVPGYGKVTNPAPSKFGSSWGGLAGGAPFAASTPTFTATAATAPTFQAQQGQQAQISPAGGAATGGTAHGDPRDPTYWTDVAKIKNTFDTNEAQYNLQQTEGQTNLSNALAKYDKQQPIDIGNARGNYNNAGLFYSSRLGGAEGDITSKYGEARNNANAGFARLVDQLNIYRNSNRSQYGTDAAGNLTGTAYLDALNNATSRRIAADQALAEQNILAGLNPDGSPKEQPAAGPVTPAQAATMQPGGMVNGQFQSQILSPPVVKAINQWIQQTKPKTGWGGAATYRYMR